MPANPLNKRIVKFIKSHHILTIATSVNNEPYCATCFYSYIEEDNLFIITSDYDTKHARDMLKQNRVSGAIALETKIIGKIRGIQFTGNVTDLSAKDNASARKSYLMRFPFAILKETTLWSIEPDYIKMTDNRLGFGKKIYWNK
jgi:uncharacterized protein